MKLYCPVHRQWFDEGITVCPIGDCATKLVENWQLRTTGMMVPNPNDAKPAPVEQPKPERKPIWAGIITEKPKHDTATYPPMKPGDIQQAWDEMSGKPVWESVTDKEPHGG